MPKKEVLVRKNARKYIYRLRYLQKSSTFATNFLIGVLFVYITTHRILSVN